MSRNWYGWSRYVPVAERRRRSAAKLRELTKKGRRMRPVEIDGRKIAKTFWGQAWCQNLESYSDYSNRLPRGRTYARNGSVIDLQVGRGCVRALVSGSDFYEVEIQIRALGKKRWAKLMSDCAGQIGSLVELLRGTISSRVMEHVSRRETGLFPSPGEISLSCSCPDWAGMCKHVAAALYGVGARLDQEPELLFALRAVDPADLLETAIDENLPLAEARPGERAVLEEGELASIFGVEMDTTPEAAAPPGLSDSQRSGKQVLRKPRTAKAIPSSSKRSAAVQLSQAELLRLQERAFDLAEQSPVLSQLLYEIRLARGRLYLCAAQGERVARLTPVGPRSVRLELPHGKSWRERCRGRLASVFGALEEHEQGA